MNYKPLLIDLSNPNSDKPADALLPYPGKSRGHMLVELIRLANDSFTESDYLELFERRSLWPGRELPRGRGAQSLLDREARLIRNLIETQNRFVVLIGGKVWAAITRRTPPVPLVWQHLKAARVVMLPPPRSTFYLGLDDRLRAAHLLSNLATRSACARVSA